MVGVMWMKIKGFENYEISDEGLVRNSKGKVLSKRLNSDGYCRAMLSNNGVKCDFKTHRLVAMHFIPNPEGLPEVNHKDGVKDNNHYTNLEWMSHGDNMRHASSTGLVRVLRGDERPWSKLNDGLVSEILEELSGGARPTDLAKKYKVSPTMISRIKYNKAYTHVKREG